MPSNREHIHLTQNYKSKGGRTVKSAFCNKGWKGVVKVDIKAFLAVKAIQPEVLCERCLKKAEKMGFLDDPEQYERNHGLELLRMLNS